MKKLLVLLFLVSCGECDQQHVKKSVEPKIYKILDMEFQEVCLNGIVYYAGWGGMSNGGPALAVKYQRFTTGVSSYPANCKE